MTAEQRRKALRLPDFDYSWEGSYFVTICVRCHTCDLGTLSDQEVILSKAGKIVVRAWKELPRHYPRLALDEFVIMPNHVHAIFRLNAAESAVSVPLTEIVRAFKTFTSLEINRMRQTVGQPFWQRNYYERIIRNQRHL